MQLEEVLNFHNIIALKIINFGELHKKCQKTKKNLSTDKKKQVYSKGLLTKNIYPSYPNCLIR